MINVQVVLRDFPCVNGLKTMASLYLDYNASTPIDPRVLEVMMPWFVDEPGNAGSRTHVYGNRASVAVERARELVAACINATAEEIVFTSGATESNNLAILGLRDFAETTARRHIVSTSIEHSSVLEPLQQLRKEGFEVDFVPVTPGGLVEPDEIKRRLRHDTLLVSVMHANNETGVLQPVLEISEILADLAPLLHVDAAQTFGKEVEMFRRLQCDLISISGHKIYGPKGIGALYVRRRLGERRPLSAILFGGGQERGLRPGTLPVPQIVGLGKAAHLASQEHLERSEHSLQIKQRLLSDLEHVDFHVNGDLVLSQSHVLNISFVGVDSEALMMAVRDELAFSNGSACTSYDPKRSHVLEAMGLTFDRIDSAVRISWGPFVRAIPTLGLIRVIEDLRKVDTFLETTFESGA
jgi:cysteine desulfurase